MNDIAEQYHLESARFQAEHLREWAAVKLGVAIEERGWTQTQTARYLGVQQPRISDLMRGKTHKFTLDTLVEWLFALDKPVALVEKEPGFVVRPSEEDNHHVVARYTRVLKDDPNHSTAYSRRGHAWLSLREYERAIADFSRWNELSPDVDGPLSMRALACQAAGQHKAALRDYATLLERFPDSNIYSNRGLLLEKMGRLDEALADFVKASEREPHRPGPHWNRAQLLERLGRFPEAIEALEKALECDHTLVQARESIERLRASQD